MFEFYHVGGQLYAQRWPQVDAFGFIWYVSWGFGSIRPLCERHAVPDDIQ